MTNTLGFDPYEYDYGPATDAIRAIFAIWASIDWFGPSTVSDEAAVELFRVHQRLAYEHAPSAFPLELELRVVAGDRHAFTGWCDRVRGQANWDWKVSLLKQLSHDHTRACGWNAEDDARVISPSAPPRPGELYFLVGEPKQLIWNPVFPLPPALAWLRGGDFANAGGFYFLHAVTDGLDAMKWQFAERSRDMRANPFVALLHCYQAGVYPFSLDRTNVVLFQFADRAR